MMENSHINLLGVKVTNTTAVELLEAFDHAREEKRGLMVFYANAHSINLANESDDFRIVLNSASFVYPDGIGVQLAAASMGYKIRENLNGTDFIPKTLSWAERKRMSVFLLGATADVIRRTRACVEKQFPALKISGTSHGYMGESDSVTILEDIKKLSPDLILVGMGTPNQEFWAFNNRTKLPHSIIICVGAFFDYFSGSVARAPLWMRKARSEWLFRLLREPRRLFRRYAIGVPRFLSRVVGNFLDSRVNRHNGN